MTSVVQASDVDNCQEVDELIASLLLRTAARDADEDTDAAFNLDASWSSTVDQLTSVAGCLPPCYDWPVDPTTTADTPASTDTAVPRRRRSRQPHTKAAVNVLRAWYDEHRTRPYASDAEVRQLATECQLAVRQVQKWLSNHRRMDGNTRRRNRPAHNAKSTTGSTITSCQLPCSD